MQAVGSAFRWLLAALVARPGWGTVAGLCALACALLLPFDRDLQAWLAGWQKAPGIGDVLAVVRCFGRGEVAVLVALAVAASGRWRLGAQMLLALAICAVLTWAFKLGVLRERPTGRSFSFVSGDTSTAWALVPLLARSWPVIAGCALVAAGVGMSRIVLGYHWPADVLGGTAVGILSALLARHAWPERPWPWLRQRRLWLGLAGIAWLGACVWAVASPKVDWLRIFLLVWGPAILGWTLWPWLLRRARLTWTPGPWAMPVLAGALALLLTLVATGSTLWDRDEPRNALAAREMLANDAWLVPTFDGEPRLHKPILPYWLMTAALRSGLPYDIACRMPAVLCMALAVLLLGLSLRRLLGTQSPVAVIAMAALAGSPLVLVSGSAATTDAALMLGIAATMWVLFEAAIAGLRWWHIPAAGLAIGWALLSKGPMAILVPVATFAVASVLPPLWARIRRQPAPECLIRPGAWLVLVGGLLIGSLLALAWFVPANRATDGAMLREMIGDHVVKRALQARESHGGKLWYYLPILVVGFLAWLPALVVAVRGSGLDRRAAWLLWAWAIPVLVVLSLVQTKLPHYLLPMLWPVAGLVAAAVLGQSQPVWWAWGRRVQLTVLVLVSTALLLLPSIVVMVVAAGWMATPMPLGPLVLPACAAGLAFALLSYTVLQARSRTAHAVAATVGMTVLGLTLALNLWRIEIYKPAPRMAKAILNRIPVGVPIATCGFDEPSLYFYLGPERGPIAAMGANQLKKWSRQDGTGVCVTTAKLLSEAGPLPTAEIVRVSGYNYSNGKPVELVLLGRSLPTR
jgi:4-amino-4-deoxy-L-arabinose transferase-like glycosyltransferase